MGTRIGAPFMVLGLDLTLMVILNISLYTVREKCNVLNISYLPSVKSDRKKWFKRWFLYNPQNELISDGSNQSGRHWMQTHCGCGCDSCVRVIYTEPPAVTVSKCVARFAVNNSVFHTSGRSARTSSPPSVRTGKRNHSLRLFMCLYEATLFTQQSWIMPLS